MSDSESVKLHYKVFRHSVVPSITSRSVSESIKLHQKDFYHSVVPSVTICVIMSVIFSICMSVNQKVTKQYLGPKLAHTSS